MHPCRQPDLRAGLALLLVLMGLFGCYPRGPAQPHAKAAGPSPPDTVDAPARLLDLLKPEFRELLPSEGPEWRSDTLDIGEGTCILVRSEPYFPKLRRPNRWLNEVFASQMQSFVDACEASAMDPRLGGGEFEGYFRVETGRVDANLVSLSVECAAQFPGGRSQTMVHSLNFKPSFPEEYTIYDLFTIPRDSVDRLLKRLVIPRISDATLRDGAFEMVFDGGLNPPGKAFSTFRLDGEDLTVVLHSGVCPQWTTAPDYVALALDTEVE